MSSIKKPDLKMRECACAALARLPPRVFTSSVSSALTAFAFAVPDSPPAAVVFVFSEVSGALRSALLNSVNRFPSCSQLAIATSSVN